MSEQTDIAWAKAARIALVVPGDSQVDDEFWRLLAPHGIPLVSRTTGAEHQQMATIGAAAAHTKSLAESSDIEMAADRLRAVRAVAAAYVDTSISFIRGPGGDIDISDRIENFLGVPTVSTSTAVVHACRTLGVSSIGVLTVYVDEVNDTMPTFFEPQGIRVARMHKADSSMEAGNTSEELGRMSAAELVALGRSLDGDDVGAIFIPCTAVRTLDAIEPLEEAIGKPVITAIQATMWRVARLAGLGHDAPQGGKLFEIGGI
jgi:maleate cis-trans isomerase